LERELNFLESYLEIQRLSVGDRLRIDWTIAPETLEASVPGMILQPLIENAIKHGVSVKPGTGHITIEAARENGFLRLRVSDNGPGFQQTITHGIGLTNTCARLEQLYGPDQRMEYGQSASGGASVTITIPFIRMSGLGEGRAS
jgi:sensor histidine kinase YesM